VGGSPRSRKSIPAERSHHVTIDALTRISMDRLWYDKDFITILVTTSPKR
jgi:hypothetical protein